MRELFYWIKSGCILAAALTFFTACSKKSDSPAPNAAAANPLDEAVPVPEFGHGGSDGRISLSQDLPRTWIDKHHTLAAEIDLPRRIRLIRYEHRGWLGLRVRSLDLLNDRLR